MTLKSMEIINKLTVKLREDKKSFSIFMVKRDRKERAYVNMKVLNLAHTNVGVKYDYDTKITS